MRARKAVRLVQAAVICVAALAAAEEQKNVVGSEKQPAPVPQQADKIAVDGDLAEWAKIKALPAPYSKKDAGMVKLVWREDGLYGCAQVKDAKIEVDADKPWTGDCVELWLETDFARAEAMGDNTFQIILVPNPGAGAGKCTVVAAQGPIGVDAITAMWKPTDGGYSIEFFIPAKELRPAKMAEGTKIGFNYAVDDGGKAVEQFYSDKDTDQGYCTPKTWGAIQLSK